MKDEIIYPNFLIVGAARSGTTSLYNYLLQHPKVFLPKIKEPSFFSFANARLDFNVGNNNHVTNPEKYFDLFSSASHYVSVGEASTPYLYLYHNSISNIQKYIP